MAIDCFSCILLVCQVKYSPAFNALGHCLYFHALSPLVAGIDIILSLVLRANPLSPGDPDDKVLARLWRLVDPVLIALRLAPTEDDEFSRLIVDFVCSG